MSLYRNIHAKRKRIKAGSGEKMRKPGAKGAPTAGAFKAAAKTVFLLIPGRFILYIPPGITWTS